MLSKGIKSVSTMVERSTSAPSRSVDVGASGSAERINPRSRQGFAGKEIERSRARSEDHFGRTIERHTLGQTSAGCRGFVERVAHVDWINGGLHWIAPRVVVDDGQRIGEALQRSCSGRQTRACRAADHARRVPQPSGRAGATDPAGPGRVTVRRPCAHGQFRASQDHLGGSVQTTMTATAPTVQNFIGSEYIAPATGETEAILNPATGEVIAHAPMSGQEDVDRAVSAAKQAFPQWSTTTPGERALALLKLADAIEEHADELSNL